MQNVSLLYQLKFSLEIATQGKLVGKTSLLLVISMFPVYNKYIYIYVVRWKRGDKNTCMICTFHVTCNMDTKMMSQLFQLKICSTITKLQTS